MRNTNPNTLRFPAINAKTIRADFEGGAMSSDFGALLMSGVNRQTGLIGRLSGAIKDQRHASYTQHSIENLLAQRIFQSACGYEDGNDANSLRHDPLFKLALAKSQDDALASNPTFCRFENSLSAKDMLRMAHAFVEAFIDSYSEAPASIILDMDHSEDITHGQQQLGLFNGYYHSRCYLPLFLFEGLSGKFICAILRPGKRPTGAENAAILSRVIKKLRQAWPDTHIVLRGDGHFANPALMALCDGDDALDFVFGLTGNKVLSALAQPHLDHAQQIHQVRINQAQQHQQPSSTKVYEDIDYQAGSWSNTYRVVVKAEVMALGENPRYVVSSLTQPSALALYEDFYCPRGQDENYIKALKNDLAVDRTSCHRFIANQMRVFYACAAYSLIHALRENTLQGTQLAKAQPKTLMLKLFKIAVRVRQYKDRIKLQLPSHYTLKAVLHRVCELLYLSKPPQPA